MELTVQRVDRTGRSHPYLVDALLVGGLVEIRGPVGGWFVWQPEQPEPVLLVAGGSGIVPLMSMIRTRESIGSRVPFRLLYSVRDPADRLYADRAAQGRRRAWTRRTSTPGWTPDGWPRPAGRLEPDRPGAVRLAPGVRADLLRLRPHRLRREGRHLAGPLGHSPIASAQNDSASGG